MPRCVPIWGLRILLHRSHSISPPPPTCITFRQDACTPRSSLRPAILAIRELVLKAGCKPGTDLTSYLPKRKGRAASYPGRIGQRSLTAFSHLLPLLSRRKAFWTQAFWTQEPRRERGKRGFCQGCLGQATVVPRLPRLASSTVWPDLLRRPTLGDPCLPTPGPRAWADQSYCRAQAEPG